MRSKEEILSEVLDSLIWHGDGRTPPEIRSLAAIGARLRNECPDADPAFLQQLQERLQAEWAPPGRAQLLLAAPTGWLPRPSPRLWRATAGALVAAALFLALLAWAPGLGTVQANLGRVVTLFQQARVEEWPREPPTPLPPPETCRTFSSLEEAQAAADFTIRAPAYLPPGLTLLNVEVAESPGLERAILQYGSPYADLGPQRENLTIQQFRVDPAAGEAPLTLQADLSGAERLEVAGRTALWIPSQPGGASSRSRVEHGSNLLIQDGQVLIQLLGTLGRDESVRIAESMF